MRFMLIIVIALAGSLGLGIFLKDNPGRLIFTYGDITVQTSFALFIISSVLLCIVIIVAMYALNGLIHLPKNLSRWANHRRRRRSEKYITQGLLDSLEGNWKHAEDMFRKGASYSREPMLNYIGAARAAQQLGAVKRRDHYLRLAHEYSTNSPIAVSLTQAELQLNQKQIEQAYATLKHIDKKGAGQNRAKLMLLETSAELKEWDEVLELLQDLEKRKLLEPEKIKAKELEAYAGLMRKTGGSLNREGLEKIWAKIPKKLRAELYLIEVYVTERLRFSGTADCEELLRHILKHRWDDAIVRLYGLVEGYDFAKQLSFAEGLLKAHARAPVLLLTLGRICKRKGLWGKAGSYLEECIDIQPSPEAYQELASLLEQKGDSATAAEYYQKGLNLATGIASSSPVLLGHNAVDEN